MSKHPRNYLLSLLILAVCLQGTALAAAPAAGDGGVVFSYLAPDAATVFLAGDFNGWNATALALTKGADGVWTLAVALEPGRYEYKFVVDGNWVEDPDNPEKQSDPFGGSNSLVTVAADGQVAAVAGAAAPVAAATAAPASVDKITVRAPIAVDGGIQFTYAGNVGAVFLAGTFNGWNATELPLAGDGAGKWIIVHALPAGQHEYKFVVDGNWLADPENPDTQSDPYGGVNSLVVVGEDGQLVAAGTGGDDGGASETSSDLNARLTLSGRYLTRFELAQNVDDDPRWRLQRPSQSVDLNFSTEVSDVVDSYVRIRMDSEQNLIQNNIAGFLDEAHIYANPGAFSLSAYWNEEIYTSGDIMRLGGNINLPGTIGHDHLDYGKGTAGALFEADPWGMNFVGYFANIHNQDYYNDPEFYDNTGGDAVGLRLSKEFGNFEVAIPAWLRRDLIWLSFEDRVNLPSTGIPALDQHLAESSDSSTWFENDSHSYNAGLEARYRLNTAWRLAAQGIYIDDTQRFVTGNETGQNNSNGTLEVPYLERDSYAVRLQVDYTPEKMDLMFQHTRRNMDGADPDQRFLEYTYLPQTEANKQIYYEIHPAPAQANEAFTELEMDWQSNDRQLKIWAWHLTQDRDYGAAGATTPGDTTRTDSSPYTWYLSGLVGAGMNDSGLGHGELEFGLRLDDLDVLSQRNRSLELIARYDRQVTRNMAAIADLRFIRYNLEGEDADGAVQSDDNDYFNPFVGLRYIPLPSFELVFGYGVDPVDFSIDYQGRQLGRWWYRQNYLFAHPGADLQEAENNLAKARVFTLRAQFLF